MIQIGFPSFLAYQASLGRLGSQAFGTSAPPAPAAPPGINLTLNLPPGGQMPRVTVIQASDLNIYTIPPVWKRVAAETIDFLILIVLKVMITFIAVDFFELVDLGQYDLPLDILSIHPDKLDVRLALQFTQEILVIELVHRMVVCLFEALCTHRSVGPPGMPGGATPGKVVMGLRIVKCNQVTSLGGNRVRVLPASDLGLGWAAIRSILKNFSLAFFFPVCFSLLFLPFSRTLYDIMARSIVVESHFRLGRPRPPAN